MNQERKIEVDEVDAVEKPPRARVDPESAAATFERKRDYLTGFLAEQPAEAPVAGAGGDLQAAIVEALKMSNWVQKDAAELLGISPRVMNYKIKTLGIDYARGGRRPMQSVADHEYAKLA